MEEKRKVFISIFYPAIFVSLLWVIELIQHIVGFRFTQFGLLPGNFQGLRGVLFSPFLHSGFSHLINNSLPLLVMGTALFYFYKKVAWKVVVMIIILGGFWTWIMGRYSFHIGASGLVYGLFGFLLVSGFIRRNKSLMSISFLMAFVYGSMVWGILPFDYKMSWEGHLWGLLAGMAMAYFYRKQGPQREEKVWFEDDDSPFEFPSSEEFGPVGEVNLSQNDKENQNEKKDNSQNEKDTAQSGSTADNEVKIIYHIRNKSKD